MKQHIRGEGEGGRGKMRDPSTKLFLEFTTCLIACLVPVVILHIGDARDLHMRIITDSQYVYSRGIYMCAV